MTHGVSKALHQSAPGRIHIVIASHLPSAFHLIHDRMNNAVLRHPRDDKACRANSVSNLQRPDNRQHTGATRSRPHKKAVQFCAAQTPKRFERWQKAVIPSELSHVCFAGEMTPLVTTKQLVDVRGSARRARRNDRRRCTRWTHRHSDGRHALSAK